MKFNSPIFPLTVVIPTLGGDSLFKTIELINSGTIVPEEILVCIPKEEAYRVLNHNLENVKVVSTNCKGQVQQRAEGFKEAKHSYVMQVDDDIELGADSIAIMIKMLEKLGCGSVIGPSFYDPVTLAALHEYDFGVVGFLKSLNASFFSAAPWGIKRMGKVTRLGIAYGVDPALSAGDTHQVDWLPGGCVLNFKEDLIGEIFFPLPGKAFSEDVVHSLLRTSKNIEHYVAINATAKTTVEEEPFSIRSFKTELKARSYVVKLLHGNKLRLFIWCLSQLLIRQIKRR
jgi:hypothetical protein